MLNTCVCMRQGERPTPGLSNQVKLWSAALLGLVFFFQLPSPLGTELSSQLAPPPSFVQLRPPKTASSRQPSTTWVELLSVGPGATTTASGGL